MHMPYAIVGIAKTLRELQAAMDATTHVNRAQLRRGDLPRLYESGVVYERETRARPPVGVERFQTARDAYYLGHSDCDGLAPWRAAELRELGEDARAVVVEVAPGSYHVVVEREDGRIEDPSAMLGMLDGYGVGDDARDTARERRKRFLRRAVDGARRLLRRAASASSEPQRQAATAAARALMRHARGLATQQEADEEEAE